MKTSKENEKLESLLAQGAITEDEYNTLIKKNQNISSGQGKKADITSESSPDAKKDIKIVDAPSRYPEDVVKAGSHIQKAVGNKIASVIFNALAIIVFLYILIDSLPNIVQGRVDFLEIAIIPLFFMFIGFIFWVFYLKNLSRSGLYLQTSEAIYRGRGSIKITPSVKRQESKGLKVGQKFEGGIIGFFSESGEYVGIVAESDLPEKMNYDQAKISLEKFNSNGYTDWSLPDHNEMRVICNNISDIGNFNNDNYWVGGSYKGGIGRFNFVRKSANWAKNSDLNFVRPVRTIKVI